MRDPRRVPRRVLYGMDGLRHRHSHKDDPTASLSLKPRQASARRLGSVAGGRPLAGQVERTLNGSGRPARWAAPLAQRTAARTALRRT